MVERCLKLKGLRQVRSRGVVCRACMPGESTFACSCGLLALIVACGSIPRKTLVMGVNHTEYDKAACAVRTRPGLLSWERLAVSSTVSH